MSNTRAKFGYLSYDDMISRIESGEINQYDIIFTRNSNSIYIISENLIPIEIRARVYVFDSVEEANTSLNVLTDTYVGQVVSILDNDVYRGYIVNQDKDGTYVTTPLWEHPKPIDYNTLGNRPIINLVGTLDKPIMVSDLAVGIYSIKGQYQISEFEETIYLSATDVLIMVSENDKGIIVKKITSDTIIDYVITDSDMVSDSYVTNSKIESLYSSIEEDVKKYVEEAMQEFIENSLNDVIEARFDELIEEIQSDQVSNLFN